MGKNADATFSAKSEINAFGYVGELEDIHPLMVITCQVLYAQGIGLASLLSSSFGSDAAYQLVGVLRLPVRQIAI